MLPKLPYLDPPASVVSSRILDVVDGRAYVSRVAFVEKDGRPIVRKQTSFELAEREHALLSLVSSDHFPKPISARRDGPSSVCEMELVDGYPLSDLERFVAEMSPEGARAFLLECVEILAELAARGITHRDIRPDNILVRDGRPVLIDFGWAVSPEHPYVTPAGLGDAGRAPEGFCDAYAMGVALTPAFAHHPELLHVLAAMTRPAAERVTDPAALRTLVDAGSPAPAEVAAAVCRIAEQAIGSGALEPAQAALERALEIAPDDAALLAAAGTVRLALGDAAAAEALLDAGARDRAREPHRPHGPRARRARPGPRRGGPRALRRAPRRGSRRHDRDPGDEPGRPHPPVPRDARVVDAVAPLRGRRRRQRLDRRDRGVPAPGAGGRRSCARSSRGENLGFGKACNLGASLARGSSIVLLNNDTIPGAGWLEALLEVAEDKTGRASSAAACAIPTAASSTPGSPSTPTGSRTTSTGTSRPSSGPPWCRGTTRP